MTIVDSTRPTRSLGREVSFRLEGVEHPRSKPQMDDVFPDEFDDEAADSSGSLQLLPEPTPSPQAPALEKTLATVETKFVRLLRYYIWLGLAATTVISCAVVYWYFQKEEKKSFEEAFQQLAEIFVVGFHSHIKLQLQVVDLLATALATTAVETQQVWPFVTVQEMEALSTAARSIVASPHLVVSPKVSDALMEPWEQYTQQVKHIQWINRSLEYQQAFEQAHNQSNVADRRLITVIDVLLNTTNNQTIVVTTTDLPDDREVALNATSNTTNVYFSSTTSPTFSNIPTRPPTRKGVGNNTNNSNLSDNIPSTSSPTFVDVPTQPPSEAVWNGMENNTNNDISSTTTDLSSNTSSTSPTSSNISTQPPNMAVWGVVNNPENSILNTTTDMPNNLSSNAPTFTDSATPPPREAMWNGIFGTNPHIFRRGDPSPESEQEQAGNYVNYERSAIGPFYPIWQSSPFQGGVSLSFINYNLLDPQSEPPLATPFEIVQNQSQAVYGQAKNNASDAAMEPSLSLYYPIFDTWMPSDDRKVVAILELEYLFSNVFSYILPTTANAITAVISNGCQQQFSYEVTGDSVVYLGAQDLHQSQYESLRLSTLLTDFDASPTGTVYIGVDVNQEYCPWQLEVYATSDMESAFTTSHPGWIMAAVLVVLLWTCTIFMIYDWLVERRQQKVMQTAIRSDHIVSQLFPNAFRDALYHDHDETTNRNHDDGLDLLDVLKMCKAGMDRDAPGSGAMHEDIIAEFKRSVGADPEMGHNPPMAKLYPNCTVFFADIAGFTAWSSARDPVQVFLLLETLYGAFDRIAHKRQVFKIETIGDCYVAVTGLPQPQPNHALLMVKFARDCLETIPGKLDKLAVTLGPDTRNLAMRVGVHSGPVTAGVLRGEKARFQLFGDTVNTAARMESNGKKDCIHASQETADILFAANKGHWVHARGERIFAKGKGELQTFWIVPNTADSIRFDESRLFEIEDEDIDAMVDESEKETALVEEALLGIVGTAAENAARLKWAKKNFKNVGWIVELLYWEMKGLTWERRRGTKIDEEDIWIDGESIAAMEVKWEESLSTAFFELGDSTDQRGAKSWKVVGDTVKDQLQMLVLTMVFKYKEDAAYHNFDHACQVLISADKMLKQMNLSFGKNRHVNSWVKFTVFFAVIICDVNPSSLGMNRVPDSLPSTEQNKKVYKKALNTAWDIIMDKRFGDLRQCLCVNRNELYCFRQLLVNLVFASNTSIGPHVSGREERFIAAFQDKENADTLIHKQAASILEHVCLLAQWTHTVQLWETYKKWNSCMFHQLCKDFDKGIIKSDPAGEWYQQELVLFDRVIIPMLERLQQADALGATGSEFLRYATHNRRAWGRIFLAPT